MAADLNAEEDAMCHRLIVLATLTAILVSAPPAHAVTITFETRAGWERDSRRRSLYLRRDKP